MVNLILVLILLVAACAASICAYHAYMRRRLSEEAWAAKIRVLEIEKEIALADPGSSHEELVAFLSDLVSDDAMLRKIHDSVNEKSSRKILESGSSLDDYLVAAFGMENLEQLREALRCAANASILIGSNRVLHSEVRDRDLVRESFGLFAMLMGTVFIERGVPSSQENKKVAMA